MMKRLFSMMILGLVFTSCADQSGSTDNVPVESESPKESIRIVERMDTIVAMDPSTGKESVQVVTSYDTIVEMAQ